jgi:hypothetical protein
MPETLTALLQAHFGMKTTWKQNPLVSQVAITVTKVIAANPNRLGLVITNAGANTVYLSPKNTVAVGAGIVLVPTGGAASFKWDIDFELVASEWYGIASGAASNVNVLEITTV